MIRAAFYRDLGMDGGIGFACRPTGLPGDLLRSVAMAADPMFREACKLLNVEGA